MHDIGEFGEKRHEALRGRTDRPVLTGYALRRKGRNFTWRPYPRVHARVPQDHGIIEGFAEK